ncbi:hypothetical protein CN689_25870 [Peribacillus butanolivorans]|uniref:Uncharacterized protein n=1 Tax=Peribacillus butanolivorans TaxID=421767 RepID=A0AAX0RXE8_9BACI|nr:hypothetical protein CN689_25870 [Peribacillus butanolivorans]
MLLGIEENNRIKPACIMEFVTPAARKQFYNQYQDLIVEENKKFIYLDHKIKCRVKFRNKNGLLRIPSIVEYIITVYPLGRRFLMKYILCKLCIQSYMFANK